MLAPDRARELLAKADLIVAAPQVARALDRLALEINAALADENPLLLSVMGGAVVFTGQLLPLLTFPLDFETIHITRYGDETQGGQLTWHVKPRENVRGRTVLILDDILDEGRTLAAIRDMVLELGASRVLTAVFADKAIGRAKPITADFVGVTLPNRFVFGYGMDVSGAWRNLPAIYAVRQA